jgi:glycosyltransferase involved in cell wall biosynthesis
MTTIHLVYPHGSRISCPDAIGRNVAERLRARYNVRLYDWDDPCAISPGDDDVLLGHPNPAPWSCFRLSMARPGWRKVIAMSPYTHGDIEQVAFLDPIIARVERYLAITGNYWYTSIGQSALAHWRPKMTHLDLAIDRADFPTVKRTFNPPGTRRFVYIGHSGWYKNVAYLSAIARELPGMDFAWIGKGRAPIAGLTSLGFQDFRNAAARELVASYDFMLTVGRADANPTTILEAMAWGLIPVCTPQSGYIGYPGIINVPLDNPQRAAARLRLLQGLPDATLRRLQQGNWALLDQHFTWDRFAGQVVEAIEAPDLAATVQAPPGRQLRLLWMSLTSPYSLLRPQGLMMGLGGVIRRCKYLLAQ